MRVHIFGASGAGTTTIGRELARREGWPFFDSDDFYWLPTDPPYRRARELAARQRLLGNALSGVNSWILSGSICGWGDAMIGSFELVVFVLTATDLRLERLRTREQRRFGDRVSPAGDMRAEHDAFLEWAGRYDDGSIEIRSRRLHDDWLQKISCRIVRVDGSRALATLCSQITTEIAA